MLFRAITVWLVILVFASLNGVLREVVLLPQLGHAGAYVASGLLLSVIVLIVAIALVPWLRPASSRGALAVGAFWLALTLAFEFGLGLAQGRSWPEMLAPYTFADGNIWPIVLVVVLLAPLIARRVRQT